MTYKNAKTILFASLIAAMILPFSGMISAEVEQSTEEKTKQKIKEEILKHELATSLSETDRYELKQLKLADEWLKARDNGDREQMDRIMAEITKDFPKSEDYTLAVDDTKSDLSSSSTIGPIDWQGSTEKNYNCASQSDDLGDAYGTVTAYGSGGTPGAGWSYWGSNMDYTSVISDPYWPGCADKSWDHAVTNIVHVFNGAQNCKIDTYSSSTDGEGKVCYDIEGGFLVVVESQSFYSSGNTTPFSPWASEDLFWIV